jgi:putative redox protein
VTVAKPPTVIDLTWLGDLTFAGNSDDASVILDSAGLAGPSPMQALGFALAGCMTTDVAYILTKGRHRFRALRSRLVADRSPQEPHRFVRITLHLTVEGEVAADAVDRAITLSRQKYCSVWHSMRQDIDFTTTHDIRP